MGILYKGDDNVLGNNWGCEGGKCGSGLGPQEEFVGCSDIAIKSNGGLQPQPPKPSTTSKPTTAAPTTTMPTTRKTTTMPTTRKTTTTPTTRRPTTTRKPSSHGKPIIVEKPVTPPWYTRATTKQPVRTWRPNIGSGKRKVCQGTAFYGPRFNTYCNLNCNAIVPYCPPSHCTCSS